MDYIPSINDIPEDETYTPSTADIPQETQESATENILKHIQNQQEPQRKIFPYEQTSNPIEYPGFNKLTPRQKREAIAFSQFDPANQTMTGGFVPPGTYEQPATRMAASLLPASLVPEFRAKGPLMDLFGAPIINALSRIGAGVGSNLLYQSPNIRNLEDLKRIAKDSGWANALLEVPMLGARFHSTLAELGNPLRYTQNKLNTIRNEHAAAKALESETFKPVFVKYGEQPVELPKFTKNEKQYFTPKLNRAYNDLKSEPNFNNLHTFQSIAGSEGARYAGKDIYRSDVLKDIQNTSQDYAQNFLSKDPLALEQYKKARGITKNIRAPYESTPTLRQITRGHGENITPDKAVKSIKQAMIKESRAIPPGHPLEKHMHDINFRLDLGNSLLDLIPKKPMEWFPNLPKFTQRPTVNTLSRNLIGPAYYAGGRAFINENNE